MKDVAIRAGVSRTTVSLVLSGSEARISDATRRRVEVAARELNFRPSVAAQQLRTRKSRIVGLIGDEIATGPFAGGLIAGAQAAASGRDHALVVMNTGREGDLSLDVDALEDRGADALVFATVMTRPVRIAKRAGLPDIILLNCFDDKRALPSVLPDDKEGGSVATGLAADAGHERIALIGGERLTLPAKARLAGYREALKARGIPFDPALVRSGNWHADSGYEEARKVLSLRRPPTALLCGNDRMALGTYDAVKELGLRIPEDISVIGYDDQEEIVRYMRPPLTTMRIPYYEMGELAVAGILDGHPPAREMLRCEAVVRGSLARHRLGPG
jgi:LacI family transcriptional regulator